MYLQLKLVDIRSCFPRKAVKLLGLFWTGFEPRGVTVAKDRTVSENTARWPMLSRILDRGHRLRTCDLMSDLEVGVAEAPEMVKAESGARQGFQKLS
jgi:hypothetical protein